MDYDVLNQRLRTLADAYTQADRQGTRLSQMMARSAVVATPAAAAVQQLSRALFAQTAQQGQTMDALEVRLRGLDVAQRNLNLRREEHLERMAAGRQEVAALQAELTRIQQEQRLTTQVQVRLQAERRALRIEEVALVGLATRTPQQEKRLTKVRKEARTVERQQALTDTEELRLQREALRNTEAQMRAERTLAQNRVTHQRTMREQIQQLREQRREFQLTAEATLEVSKVFRDAGHAVARVFTVTGAALAVREHRQFNQTLLAANVALDQRAQLWKGILAVQERTGDSLQNLTELSGVLRSQAMLYRKDWADILTVSSKLSQGLGASASEIGEMLNASRALRVSFRELADSVTNVVDKTSLSVRETVGLVTELRRVLTGFNVRAVGGALEGPLRHLAALEEAMKERGATEGGALRVLKQFTSMQQKGGLGMMLQSGGVDFLRDPTRTEAVTRNLVRFLEPVRNVPIVFEQMAASMGLAADDAQILIDAVRKQGQTERALAYNRIDLDKRFAQQSAVSGKVWGQFGQQLKALLLEGLTPLTRIVVGLNAGLVKFRETLVTIKAAIPEWAKGATAVGFTTVAVVGMGVAAVMAARRVMLTVAALRALSATNGVPGVGGWLRGAPARVARPALLGVPSRGAPTLAAARAARAATATATGASLAATRVARTVGGVTAGASALVRGLVPLASAALPVLVPVIVAAVAAYATYRWFKAKEGAEDRRKEDLVKEILSNRQQSYQKVDTLLRDQLRAKDGRAAADNFQTALDRRKNQMLIDAERGETAGLSMMRELSKEFAARLEAGSATVSREQGRAPVERMNELKAGQEALVKAMQQVEKTIKDLAVAAERGATTRQKQATAEEQRADEKARVEQAARAAADAGRRAMPGMMSFGR